jgi:Raf kinase inhibitor-like YbhB/YbcL family protein
MGTLHHAFGPIPLREAALTITAALLTTAAALTGCRSGDPTGTAETGASLTLSTTSFQDGIIPKQFTCDGADTSPQLAWTAPPPATKSFALIVTDPDAPVGPFVHWVLYNIPATRRDLSAGLPQQDRLEDFSRQGRNDFGKTGYGGPCPPGASSHHYIFSLYALDTVPNLPSGITGKQLEEALKGHILARGQLIARFSR